MIYAKILTYEFILYYISYQMSMILGYKSIVIRKSEFMTRTQFLHKFPHLIISRSVKILHTKVPFSDIQVQYTIYVQMFNVYTFVNCSLNSL